MAMTRNVGMLDAAVRLALGVIMLGLAATVNQRPLLAVGAAIVGLILLATGLTRTCPLYIAMGVSTEVRTPRAGPS
jgi:hypothetical protein